ncbi:MAG: glycosyltransferase family 2 protein [Elusimicrobia bacterium]|nr:glycosyltransferase family 2 protein [Elusimicrobiota bacterium]
MRAQLSFVVITYRRPELLMRCLESLDRARGTEAVEVWAGFNGFDASHAPLKAWIEERYPYMRVLELERVSRPAARNRVVKETCGRIICFLDDDTEIPEGFAERLVRKFERYPRVLAMGGPNIGPADAAPFERAVDFLLRSPWGAGPTRIRHRPGETEQTLPGWCFTLSNLAVRREVFERHGLFFSEDCASAEENLLLFRIEGVGGALLYASDLYVFHRRRGRLGAFCLQAFTSGRGRGQITRSAPGTFQYFVLIPVAWSFYLAGLFWLWRTPHILVPLLVYTVCGGVECVRLAYARKDPRAALWVPLLGFSGHVAYAAGVAAGFFQSRVRL